MTAQQDIAKSLEARAAELRARVAGMDNALREPLSADFEEQAADLEAQDALGGVEDAVLQEIAQIEEALKRIADGNYGVCTSCGEDIAPKRLAAQPTATRCINCAK